MGDADDTESLLSPGERVEVRRDRDFGRRHAETYEVELYSSEQEVIKESMRRRVREHERGTSPETLFKNLYQMVVENGNAIVLTAHNDRLVPVASGDKEVPWLGLDEKDRMEIGEMPRAELLGAVDEELEGLTREEFVDLLDEDASRDSLVRLLAALRSN